MPDIGLPPDLPSVDPDSPLHTMASLNPAMADQLCDAMLLDIERCLANCTIGAQGTTQLQVLEQIHSLKNSIVVTGSSQLLGACEQLRQVASTQDAGEMPPSLVRRYAAVANAATIMIKDYKRLRFHGAQKHLEG